MPEYMDVEAGRFMWSCSQTVEVVSLQLPRDGVVGSAVVSGLKPNVAASPE